MIRRRWTTADIRALMREERAWPRYELISGELLVTPAPGWAHQIAVTELWLLLHSYLERTDVGIAIISPADLELRPDTITQPDVFVVPSDMPLAGDKARWSDVRSLLLAIEVLSPSSLHVDRVEKRDFYLESAVAEYWIVDLDARVIERWTAAQETPEILHERIVWRPAAAEPLSIDLPALFERVAKKTRGSKR